jgi:murein DD-endopeptidase MepM/ murein hydrolase activator NlpD
MRKPRYMTIMLVPDGTESGRTFRIRQWLLRFAIGFAIVLVVGIVLFFSFYGKILARAAMADRLQDENQKLLRYQYKVKLLEENLVQTREVVSRLVELAGIDYEFPEFPSDSAIFAELDRQGMAVLTRSADGDLTVPSGMPVQGFLSQDFETENEERYHPGIDIACAEGTPVLATAVGEVIYAGSDETYGNMIVIKHNDSITTVYGHNKELLVAVGDKVQAGSRLALSGNTGVSTAPHLHYEMRINDQPINPLD